MAQFRVEFVQDQASGKFLGSFWRDGRLAKTEITIAEPALEWTGDEVREAWAHFQSLL